MPSPDDTPANQPADPKRYFLEGSSMTGEGLERVYEKLTGRKMTPEAAQRARELADRIRESCAKVEAPDSGAAEGDGSA
jgi:hypothetical protein